ncbi:hypothetical protein BDW02DRAFT_569248 [Decorospora gaudefroyi]|uniref:UBA domain-containing protein n=1 Tax=Decorospora gaudefroyi TaxID=184978 RepID=A0A6A5K8V5_9PLEO|nr:hypothetical protein BDW02DRAFT_569248 [Decorospora gaudefroyi]
MSRVVQDSDEELEDDLEIDLPPPKQANASDQPPSHNTAHGTGSTESLKRAIEKAHRTHLRSQPSQDEPQSSVSLPEHVSKRRKTAADAEPHNSLAIGSPKRKCAATYGKSPKHVFHNSPTSTAPVENHLGDHAKEVDLAPSKAAGWNLEGTMRNDYADHEPAMSHEPSSTVPNATMTQQRVLDVVNAPAMLDHESAAGGPRFIPPHDVRFSDVFMSTEAAEQTESPSRELPPTDSPSPIPLWPSTKNPEVPASQRSVQDSFIHLSGSPLRNEKFRAEDIRGQGGAPFEVNLGVSLDLPPTIPPRSQRNEEDGTRKSPRRRKSQVVAAPTSDDDLAAIGLPIEQYKPRPSRSRSLKINMEQPIDFSVRPEKPQKVPRRRKTTTADVHAVKITTPEKVQQICDMGFTPSTTTTALKRNDDDVMQTIDWLITNNIGHDELAPQSPTHTKPASKKDTETPVIDPETIQDIMRNLNEYRRDDAQNPQDVFQPTVASSAVIPPEPPNDATKSLTTDWPPGGAQATSPMKVQVVIPKRSPKTVSTPAPDSVDIPNKKAKRRKTTLDEPEPEPEPITAASARPEVATEKKKGRGRPKNTKTVVATESIHENSEQGAKEESNDEVLQTIEPNLPSGRAETASEITPKEMQMLDPAKSKSTIHAPKPPEKSPATASATPERSTKPTTASPITKGKATYRVGLSKRARIAPLLRTLKK